MEKLDENNVVFGTYNRREFDFVGKQHMQYVEVSAGDENDDIPAEDSRVTPTLRIFSYEVVQFCVIMMMYPVSCIIHHLEDGWKNALWRSTLSNLG